MLNYFTVKKDLENKGWLLVSQEYKNLKAELQMKCPVGHEVSMSYENWRRNPVCNKCLAGMPYNPSRDIPPKDPNKKRTLALDAATVLTGYAIYDNRELVKYGTFKVEKWKPTVERIHLIRMWLVKMITEHQIDLIELEHVQLQGFGAHQQVELYRTLCNLQGVILDTAFEYNIESELAYSTEWRKYCGIAGKDRAEKKKNAQARVKSWYGINATDDEADAICLGKYAVRSLSSWGD